MRIPVLTKTLLTTAIAATLSLGMVAQASAAPGVYEVSPNNLPGLVPGGATYAPFGADHLSGTSSVLLTATGAFTQSGAGYINFDKFSLAGNGYFSSQTGLNLGGTNSYSLYLVFDQSSTSSGPLGSPPPTSGVLNTLNYTFWADPGSNNSFHQANANGATAADRAASVNVVGTDIKLASGSLIYGVNGFDALGGAFLNAITTIELTDDGKLLFTKPIPFFELAFSEFNNTTNGIINNGIYTSITQETGSVDFNRTPEPASIALLGLGLLGLGVSRRRKTAA